VIQHWQLNAQGTGHFEQQFANAALCCLVCNNTILNSAAKAVLYPNSSKVAGHVDALLRVEAHANSQAYILL